MSLGTVKNAAQIRVAVSIEIGVVRQTGSGMFALAAGQQSDGHPSRVAKPAAFRHFCKARNCDRNSDFKILGTRGGRAATAYGGLGMTGWRRKCYAQATDEGLDSAISEFPSLRGGRSDRQGQYSIFTGVPSSLADGLDQCWIETQPILPGA
jgi:hypothetical protein